MNNFKVRLPDYHPRNTFHWKVLCYRLGYRSYRRVTKRNAMRDEIKATQPRKLYAEYQKDYVHYKRENRRTGPDKGCFTESMCKAWHYVKMHRNLAAWYFRSK